MFVESLPDPFDLREHVASGAGYLQGGLNRENWERAITAITKMSVKKISHPGINFLVKHVGQIFRNLFSVALDDVKKGEEFSATLKLMPTIVETHLSRLFDNMLWKLMEQSAKSSHTSLEPMYSTLDPSLPTFQSYHVGEKIENKETYIEQNGQFVKTPNKKEIQERGIVEAMKEKVACMLNLDGKKAKQYLTQYDEKRATRKSGFLPDKRTAMMTKDEINVVVQRAFEYIIALVEFNLIILRFQINHYLYIGFKDRLDSWTREVVMENWDNLVEPDESIQREIDELEGKIIGLQDSLLEVQRIQSKF